MVYIITIYLLVDPLQKYLDDHMKQFLQNSAKVESQKHFLSYFGLIMLN